MTISLYDIKPVFHFNGSSNEVTVSHHSDFNCSDAITIEANFKPDSAGTGIRALLGKGTGYKFFYSWSTGFYPVINIYVGGTNPQINAVSLISTSDFSHLVATYDSVVDRRTLRLYINGELNKEGNKLTGLPSYTITGNTSPLYIGKSGSSYYMDGQLDYLRLYNVELTPSEISGNSNGNYTKRGLVSYWRFCERMGTAIFDSQGGHTGTLG